MGESGWSRVPIEPQSVLAPLSRHAVFLVVTIDPSAEAAAHARSTIADIGGLVRSVGFRDLNGHLSCNVGVGSDAWERLGQTTRPAQLHPFVEIRSASHVAVATPGDLLFHIRAERHDLCFELERLILGALAGSVTTADEVANAAAYCALDAPAAMTGAILDVNGASYLRT